MFYLFIFDSFIRGSILHTFTLCYPAFSWLAMSKSEITMEIRTKLFIYIPVNRVNIHVPMLCESYPLLDIPTFYPAWYRFVAIIGKILIFIHWSFNTSSQNLFQVFGRKVDQFLSKFQDDRLSPKKIVLVTIGLLFFSFEKRIFSLSIMN